MQSDSDRVKAIELGINEIAKKLQDGAFNYQLSGVVLPLEEEVILLKERICLLERQLQSLQLAHDILESSQ